MLWGEKKAVSTKGCNVIYCKLVLEVKKGLLAMGTEKLWSSLPGGDVGRTNLCWSLVNLRGRGQPRRSLEIGLNQTQTSSCPSWCAGCPAQTASV